MYLEDSLGLADSDFYFRILSIIGFKEMLFFITDKLLDQLLQDTVK
jgi:hypothetical protein